MASSVLIEKVLKIFRFHSFVVLIMSLRQISFIIKIYILHLLMYFNILLSLVLMLFIFVLIMLLILISPILFILVLQLLFILVSFILVLPRVLSRIIHVMMIIFNNIIIFLNIKIVCLFMVYLLMIYLFTIYLFTFLLFPNFDNSYFFTFFINSCFNDLSTCSF